MKSEHVAVWQFIASRNDDEIYAYGTDSQAKQFCQWLNQERTSDRYTYNEVTVNKTRSIKLGLWTKSRLKRNEYYQLVAGFLSRVNLSESV